MPVLQGDDECSLGPDCPPWCDGKHEIQPGFGDSNQTVHVRSAGIQPVIAAADSGMGRVEMHSTEFEVLRYQGTAETEEWVFVGDDNVGFTVSRESAARICRALGEVLVEWGPC